MPMSVLEKRSTSLCFSAPETAPASVTSRPSRIQVMPSATTTSVWNRPHGSRSSRAGMSVSTIALSGPACACMRFNAQPHGLVAARLAGRDQAHVGVDQAEGRANRLRDQVIAVADAAHLDQLAVGKARELRGTHAHPLAGRADDRRVADQRGGAVAIDQQRLDPKTGDVELARDLLVAFEHGRLAVALAEEGEDIDRPL